MKTLLCEQLWSNVNYDVLNSWFVIVLYLVFGCVEMGHVARVTITGTTILVPYL